MPCHAPAPQPTNRRLLCHSRSETAPSPSPPTTPVCCCQVIRHVQERFPKASALFAAGWSLGANILVNYLGEEGANTPVQAAVSM